MAPAAWAHLDLLEAEFQPINLGGVVAESVTTALDLLLGAEMS